MSSSKSATAPDLTIKPSRFLRGYLILITLLSLFVLWTLSIIDWHIQLPLTVLVLFSVYRAFVQHEKVVFIKHKGDERWLLRFKNGEEVKANLLKLYYVVPWVVVVNFKIVKGGRVPVVVTADRVDGEALRRLRVYLGQLCNDEEPG